MPVKIRLSYQVNRWLACDWNLHCSSSSLISAVRAQCFDLWIMVNWAMFWVKGSQSGYNLAQSIQPSLVHPDRCSDVSVGYLRWSPVGVYMNTCIILVQY